MTKQPLTEKEREMYEYISESIHKNGYSPSVRDIMVHIGFKSTSTVHTYLGKLEEKGYIYKEDGKSRTLRTVGSESTGTVRLPVIGSIAAGTPILATEVYDETDMIEVSTRGKYSRDELFALRVSGESMIEAGIFDGDKVVVKKQDTAENGDIVVALFNDGVDEGATVKRFYREEEYFRLQPENDAMEPILVKDLKILGKVFGVFRFF